MGKEITKMKSTQKKKCASYFQANYLLCTYSGKKSHLLKYEFTLQDTLLDIEGGINAAYSYQSIQSIGVI